jgi:hypothetical protein
VPLSLLPHNGINPKRNHPTHEDSRASIDPSSLGKILIDKHFKLEYKMM